jgi:eukaryotic-like serine/threonine-protein kinase
LASDAAALVRFEQEARAASALDHPSICTVYEVDEHEGKAFIVMQLLRGQTLRERIETRQGRCPFAINELLAFAVEIAEGLQAAHQKGIIHRDIKPENIFITEQGHAKILDFGVAKLVERTEAGSLTRQDAHEAETNSLGLTLSGKAVGTAAYMSPEQVRGEKLDGRTDLFSFGLVLYEMATGVRPFENEIAGRVDSLNRVYPSLRQFNPQAPARLAEIVKKALEKDRELRYQSADELAAALSRQSAAFAQSRTSRRTPILVAVIALCVAAGVMAWSARHNSKVRWARHEALPEIVRLADADRFDDAYRLLERVRPLIPDDPLLAEQMRAILRGAIIESDPAGGEVFYRPYGRSAEPWRRLGKAPVESQVPRGLMHWKIEMAGRELAEDVGPTPFAKEFRAHFTLFTPNQVPPGMVRIASSNEPFQIFMPGLEHLSEVHLPDYWMDRHEVTNRAFKRFVDEGGYRRPELWQEPFVKDGRLLTFEAAMANFRDTTGRPGPAGWEMSTYLAGQDDYPVGGVSWYEAAAFANWAGKSLPTIYHWARAADQRLSGVVVPASNVDGKSVQAVGATGGITRSGTTDMAGNVKEWVSNSTGSKRYIMGGAWNEPVYMFTNWDAQSPFTRHPNSGIRCIKVDRPEDLSPALTAVIHAPTRDVRKMKPVSSAVFEAWRSLYSFDHGDLKVQAEFVDDASPDWRMEKVSYAAAYGDERILAYLFLPKNAKPPYPAMIAFSGGNIFYERSSATTTDFDRFNYIMRSGRALLYPSTRARSSVLMPSRTILLI